MTTPTPDTVKALITVHKEIESASKNSVHAEVSRQTAKLLESIVLPMSVMLEKGMVAIHPTPESFHVEFSDSLDECSSPDLGDALTAAMNAMEGKDATD